MATYQLIFLRHNRANLNDKIVTKIQLLVLNTFHVFISTYDYGVHLIPRFVGVAWADNSRLTKFYDIQSEYRIGIRETDIKWEPESVLR